jgi:hypothetical protein
MKFSHWEHIYEVLVHEVFCPPVFRQSYSLRELALPPSVWMSLWCPKLWMAREKRILW